MKFIAFVLFVVAAEATLVPRNVYVPEVELNVRHTAEEWMDIYTDQELPSGGSKVASNGDVEARGDQGKIVGGSAAATGQFPWQVSVTMDGSFYCGGSIIGTTWVLTAGHCVTGVTSFSLVFGSLSLNGGTSGSVSMTSRTSILHAGYSSSTIANDIGLIQLATALTWSTWISAVRMPRHNQVGVTFVDEKAVIAGWGYTSDSSTVMSPDLMWVEFLVISNTACANTYGTFVRSTTICTSGLGGKNMCNGDPGSALIWSDTDGIWTEIGIASFGSSNGCEAGQPAAYTRVTGYLDWITQQTGIAIP